MARDGHLRLRITTELRAKLASLAAADRRTLSNYVEKLLEENVSAAMAAKKTSRKGAPADDQRAIKLPGQVAQATTGAAAPASNATTSAPERSAARAD
jgi:hypothetical protein